MATYECVAVDAQTQECTNWQAVEVIPPQETQPPMTKEEANDLTLAIVGFMVFVWVWKQIHALLK